MLRTPGTGSVSCNSSSKDGPAPTKTWTSSIPSSGGQGTISVRCSQTTFSTTLHSRVPGHPPTYPNPTLQQQEYTADSFQTPNFISIPNTAIDPISLTTTDALSTSQQPPATPNPNAHHELSTLIPVKLFTGIYLQVLREKGT